MFLLHREKIKVGSPINIVRNCKLNLHQLLSGASWHCIVRQRISHYHTGKTGNGVRENPKISLESSQNYPSSGKEFEFRRPHSSLRGQEINITYIKRYPKREDIQKFISEREMGLQKNQKAW